MAEGVDSTDGAEATIVTGLSGSTGDPDPARFFFRKNRKTITNATIMINTLKII